MSVPFVSAVLHKDFERTAGAISELVAVGRFGALAQTR